MPDIYRYVISRAALTAILSLVASYSISYLVVPLMGGRLEGAGLIMTLVLPVVISFPASAVQFWQFERTRRLKDRLFDALNELDEVNANLASTNMELVRERSHDPATRLLTEDVFRERMLHQPEQADIGQLVMLRVDGLAALRKSQGGMAADTALFAVATAVRSALRPADFAGRLGEYDLAVFMPGSTPILASLAVNSISQAVAAVQLPFEEGAPRPMTLSVGGVECAPGFMVEAALAAAGAELETSVVSGGNCSHWGNLRGLSLSRSAR